MSRDCGCVPGSLPQPRRLRQWASRHTRLRRRHASGDSDAAPVLARGAPLYFRAPLAPESCAHSSQLYTVAPAAAPRRAARSCLPSRRGHKRAPWMRPVQLVGGDAIRSSAFIARHRRRCQRRQLSLGATLPGVSEAIRIFGVRFFNQLALTVAETHIAFAAARDNAPTRFRPRASVRPLARDSEPRSEME
jgi:hypothetical protein